MRRRLKTPLNQIVTRCHRCPFLQRSARLLSGIFHLVFSDDSKDQNRAAPSPPPSRLHGSLSICVSEERYLSATFFQLDKVAIAKAFSGDDPEAKALRDRAAPFIEAGQYEAAPAGKHYSATSVKRMLGEEGSKSRALKHVDAKGRRLLWPELPPRVDDNTLNAPTAWHANFTIADGASRELPGLAALEGIRKAQR